MEREEEKSSQTMPDRQDRLADSAQALTLGDDAFSCLLLNCFAERSWETTKIEERVFFKPAMEDEQQGAAAWRIRGSSQPRAWKRGRISNKARPRHPWDCRADCWLESVLPSFVW